MTPTRAQLLTSATPWLAPPPKPDPRIRRAQKRARRAARAGNAANTDRLARIALAIAARAARADRAHAIGVARRIPVLLDPQGYSPAGTPNWFLNQQRLHRAGLLPRDDR